MSSIKCKTKKFLATILLILLVAIPATVPLQTKAVPVEIITDSVTAIAGWAKEAAYFVWDQKNFALDWALKVAMAEVLRQMTQAIVSWIDSGFKGNPAFITDTKQFLQNTADITIGDMLMGSSLDFLCDPFKLQVKLALGLQYQPFKEQIKCSFTSALGNVNDAMTKFTNGDFVGGGGWDSWLQLTTVPQNNQLGAMMIAQSELDSRIEANKGQAVLEANWGGGFMSWKECETKTTTTGDVSGNGDGTYILGSSGGSVTYTDAITGATSTGTNSDLNRTTYYNSKGDVAGTLQENQNCTIQTPGSVISNKINWADSSDLRKTELANDVNAIASALLSQLIKELTTGLLDRGSGTTKASTAYQDNMDYLNSLQTQLYGTSNTGYYNSDGNINFNQSFENKVYALEAINAQIAIENQYFAAQTNLYNFLDATQNAFTASNCSDTIKTNTINQITGLNITVKDLTWNKVDITNASAVTTSNIATLNTIAAQVQAATSDAAVPGIVAPLTTMSSLHSSASVLSYSAGGTFYNQVQTWVTSQINNNASVCTVDKSGLATWGVN